MGKTTTPKRGSRAVTKTSQHTTRTWFSSMVEAAKSELIAGFYKITPTDAAQMLEHNENNLPLNKGKLREYIEDFRSGKFLTNGESIIVSKEGYLNDGQHRLMACVETNIPFVSNVSFGVARESRITVDTGRTRKHGAILTMMGVPHGDIVSPAVGLYMLQQRDIYHHSATRIFPPEVQYEYWEKNTKLVARAVALTASADAKRIGRSALMAAYFLLYPKTAVGATTFFEKLTTGSNLTVGDPILVLRNRLMRKEATDLRAHERLELILRTWNTWRKGGSVSWTKNIGMYPKKIEA